MTVYFAGGAHYEFLHDKPILESFWYRRNAEKAMGITDKFFLDSGAFSAFTQGKEIDIDAFARFIHDNRENITVASSLDAIGDAKRSFELYKELTTELGCPEVIPVFHCREDTEYLKKYLDLGVPYMALGGMVPESTSWLYGWLDDLWSNYLTNDAGEALLKVHGFGLTVGKLIERYPWYSVDSTTWLNGSRFGTAIFNFEGRRLVHVPISTRNPAAKQLTSMHIDNLTAHEHEAAMNQLAAGGFTLEQIREDNAALLEFNAFSFIDWEKRFGFPDHFKTRTQTGLF